MGALDGALAKLRRAEEHVQEFNDRAVNGPESDAYTLVIDDYAEDGWHVCRAVPTGRSLDAFSLIARDILTNYRAALDYLAFQLYLASGGDPAAKGASGVYYPTAVRAQDWPAQRGGFLKGVSDVLADEVKSTQPCFRNDPGGLALADLAYFCRPDKHRELLPMGMLSGTEIGLEFDFPGEMPPGARLERVHPVGERPIENAEIHRWRIIRDGVPQTMTMLFGAPVNVNYKFTFQISLSHGTRVCRPFPEIGEEVRRIVERFEIILSP